MKPETEIRNLKQLEKRMREDHAREVAKLCAMVNKLEAENKHLREMVEFAKDAVDVLRQRIAP